MGIGIKANEFARTYSRPTEQRHRAPLAEALVSSETLQTQSERLTIWRRRNGSMRVSCLNEQMGVLMDDNHCYATSLDQVMSERRNVQRDELNQEIEAKICTAAEFEKDRPKK